MASTIVKKPKYTLKDVKALAHQLLTSRAHVNNLPILLSFISPKSPPQHVLESLLSVHSFFASVLPDLPSSSRLTHPDSTDAQLIYASWLRSKFDEFVRSLVEILVSEEADEALRELVLDTLMEFVKLGNAGRFNSSIYHKFLVALVNSSATTDFIVDLLASKYFKYIDIRYFTYISLEKLAKNLEPTDISGGKTKSANGIDESNPRSSLELSIHKMHNIISRIPPLEGKTENSEHELWSSLGFSSKAGESQDLSKPHKTKNRHINSENHTDKVLSNARLAKKIKLKFTKAWISFLRLPLPLEVYKEVLVALHQTVIPHLPNPIVLCDFLTRSYDIGGVVSVMALSSLFILMSDHGLEYPNFYEKLYALLLPSIFLAKHRAKFFQLLDICLKSPLLPAYLAAAFAKKLSRLALVVSPSGALVIIALIHNLLRRHPSINCLVHQEDGNGSANDSPGTEKGNAGSMDDSGTGVGISATKPGTDHFDNNESNPAKSHALRSSLWEIDSLRHHYCPPVSRFVLSLENDLTVRAKTTEVDIKDFCSGSYGTIFGQEIRRRVKQVPLAFYKASPASLFSDSDFAGWSFKYEGEKDGENGLLNIHEVNEVSRTKRQRVEC